METLDFSGQNLRGRSFKGQNLEGANFSYADIRGANFTKAKLKGANFSHATAGLQKRWVTVLVCISWIIDLISGVLSAFLGASISLIFDISSWENQVIGWTTLIVMIVFGIIIIRTGLNTVLVGIGAIAIAGAVATAGVIAGVLALAGATVLALAKSITAALAITVGIALTLALAITATIAGAVGIAGAIVLARVIAEVIAGVLAIATTGVLALAGFLAGVLAGALAGERGGAGAIAIAIAIAIATATPGVLLSPYIAWRAMKGDEKYSLIRSMAISFAAIGGTSFRNADLTNANFTGATFKSTDLRNATITRTCFTKTKQLNRVRPGKTYLKNTQLRQLLITGQGQDKNFDGQDLRGVNLQNAILSDASLIGADLSEANLQDADLSRVKLVKTQLDKTDFTGATLTGAYIQDWGITSDTKFNGVRCEYVYMRLPTKENPDPLRKPDNNKEVFADGEFGDFIKPIVDTLDLYHNQNVDPRAIAISFKQLVENNPDAELQIVGTEVKGDDKFLLRAKTAPDANKSELSNEYFNTYNQVRELPEQNIKLLLAEKDSQIRRLENMVMTALERPNFYSQNYQNQGDTKVSETFKNDFHQPEIANFNFANKNQDKARQQANQYNYGYEEKQSLADAAAEIQKLLEQLEKSYPTDTTKGKMALATEVMTQIENNPDLTARILSALKIGSIKAFEQALSHPAASFVIGALEDWQNTKGR